MEAFIPKQENEWEEPLSKREREIAELAARGLRNGEIAEMLHISEGTVKNHLKIVFRKLNIDRPFQSKGTVDVKKKYKMSLSMTNTNKMITES